MDDNIEIRTRNAHCRQLKISKLPKTEDQWETATKHDPGFEKNFKWTQGTRGKPPLARSRALTSR